MTDDARRELKLELDHTDGDSIAGRVSNESGDANEFIGWIGLAGALEKALEGDGDIDEAADTAHSVRGIPVADVDRFDNGTSREG